MQDANYCHGAIQCKICASVLQRNAPYSVQSRFGIIKSMLRSKKNFADKKKNASVSKTT